MKVGDRVSIVHGPGPEGGLTSRTAGTVTVPVINGRAATSPVRRDGMIAVRPDGAGPSTWIWVDPMFLDRTPPASVPRHRATDPDTSVAAGEAVRLTEGQLLVLGTLVKAGRAGLIDHEHQARNGLIPTSAGKRRKDLEREGLCEPVPGEKRLTDQHRYAQVHRVTARGIAVWQAHQQRGAA